MAGNRSLGSLTIDLILKMAGFEQGMDKAARAADKRTKEIQRAFTGSFKAIGGTIAGFVAGLATVDTAIRGFMQAVDTADRLDELSARLNISTEQLSEWGYAAKLSGTDLESLVTSIGRFTRVVAQAADDGSRQSELFKALGIDAKDAAGNLRAVQDLLPDIADRFKMLNNETLEAALAQELFGRAGAEMLEFLNRGSDGLNEFAERARELGIVVSGETAGAAAEFKDRVDDLRAVTQAFFLQVANNLLPILTDLTEQITDLVREGNSAKEVADTIAAGFKFVSTTATVVSSTIRGITLDLIALGNAGQAAFDALTGDWEGVRRNMREAAAAREMAAQESADIQRAFSREGLPDTPRSPSAEIDFTRPAPLDPASRDMEGRINRFLADPTGSGSKKSGGKSDAEREAEQLQRAYESLMEAARERLALMGTESEAAKILYQTQQGDLKGLDDALKQNLITIFERIDAQKLLQEEIDKENKAREEEARRIKDGLKYGKEVLDDLQFELALMKMTNAERATAIQLRGLEAEAIERYGEEIAEANRKIEESMKQIQLMDGMRDSFATFFEDVIGGTKSVKDAFTDMLDNINRMILQRITENWVEQLFGGFGTNQTGSAGGWLSTLASWFGGGRASGGHVGPNRMYEVNESGMEMLTVRGRDYLLTGNNSGNITPAHQIGGGRALSVTQQFINPVLADRRSDTQRAADSARKLRQAQRYA